MLQKTSELAHADPVFREAFEKTGAPIEALKYGDRTVCTTYSIAMVELAKKYEKVLSAQK